MPHTTESTKLPSGVLPVLQTPFNDDDSIDTAILKKEIDWLFEHGVDGVVLAMVSEVTRMTENERRELLQLTVACVNGRGSVTTSVGAESVAAMRVLAKAAEEAGADAVMAIPPSLTTQTVDGLFDYYRALLEATSLPVIVQDASGYLGNAIPVSALAQLYSEFPDRIGFKPEAQPLAQNHARLMEMTSGRAPVYEGTAGIGLWGGFRRGLVGTMPGSEAPWAIRKIWDLMAAGKEDDALRIHAPLCSLVSLMHSLDSYLAIEKHLLVEQGVFRNTRVRQPNAFSLDPSTEEEVLLLFKHLQKVALGV
jgi:dihydrodipicolinate synthase/N-acetylneuraminate lyase